MKPFKSPLLDRLLSEPVVHAARPLPGLAGGDQPFPFASAHLLGIGGCGMSAIALAMHACGVRVSGSDAKAGKAVQQLRDAGIAVHIGHCATNLGDVEAVVVSTAIPKTNPELQAAVSRGIPVHHRSDALAMFLSSRKSILVSGTHGKTTTTALMGITLAAAGLDPWVFVGGHVPAFRGNTRVGGMQFAAAEADESDGTFERLPANHLVVTNIEADHLDYWKTPKRMTAAYRRVVEATDAGGVVLMCEDDAGVRELRAKIRRPVLTWSVEGRDANYRAENIARHPFATEFDFTIAGESMGRFEIGVPGLHNVSNAVATLAMAIELGGDVAMARGALAAFHGVGRRFDVKGTMAGVTVIDDYAHHPSEIAATLKAASELRSHTRGRLVVVFQPHRYTRTRDFMNEFARSFGDADVLVLTGVYPAGEKPLPRAGGDLLYRRTKRGGHAGARYIADRSAIAPRLVDDLASGDVVLTLGAGDNHLTADEILDLLRINSNWNGAG